MGKDFRTRRTVRVGMLERGRMLEAPDIYGVCIG
jgi:hypothetical protein